MDFKKYNNEELIISPSRSSYEGNSEEPRVYHRNGKTLRAGDFEVLSNPMLPTFESDYDDPMLVFEKNYPDMDENRYLNKQVFMQIGNILIPVRRIIEEDKHNGRIILK